MLITGELDGIPGRVVEVHSQHGGLSVGISPAPSAVEHAALYGTPPCSSTVVIYSGFGFKGRNVIAVRSADIVLLFSGGIGTLSMNPPLPTTRAKSSASPRNRRRRDLVQTLLDAAGAPDWRRRHADPDLERLVDRCIARSCAQRRSRPHPTLKATPQ